ncbi:hypothetical protein ACQCT6_10325 [Cytobacillus gottheilii]|uniref:hypothetical protein n=1 Tax=Cytobacillus gottheilii TaxID=859144 RepID=UPI003CF3FC37
MKAAPTINKVTDLSIPMPLPIYSFNGGEDWINSVTEVTANGIKLEGISTTDLNDINQEEVQGEVQIGDVDYIIAPNPGETEQFSIDGDHIIVFYLFAAQQQIIEEGTTSLEFVIKADGYNDVTLNFTVDK